MAPPSSLSIATSSLTRIVKEEASYHKELSQQESRLQRAQSSVEVDENAEYIIKQEKRAIDETKALFPSLRERIKDALGKVEAQIEAEQGRGAESNANELTKAKEAAAQAKTSLREIGLRAGS